MAIFDTSAQSRTPHMWLWVCLLGVVPLCLTPVVPLYDFYAHVARYYALAQLGQEGWLAENYAAAWRILPNIGLDVVGFAVMSVVPPVLGAKLIAGLVVFAPFFGVLRLSRALDGQIPVLTCLLGGMVMYSYVLGWGFSGFLFGLGVGFWALAVWIEGADRPVRQVCIGAVFGVVLLLMHGFVFALWGLLLCTVEFARGGVWRGLRLVIVALPATLMFLASPTVSESVGVTTALTNLAGHAEAGGLLARLWDEVLQRGDSLLRVSESRYVWADRGVGLVLWALLGVALWRGWIRVVPVMRWAVVLAAALVVLVPPNLFGVGYLDDRMPVVLLCLLAASVRAQTDAARGLQGAFLVLFVVHQGLVSVGWAQDGRLYRAYLAQVSALDARGGLAIAVHDAEGPDRDAHRQCRPLAPLLLLTQGTAVNTFANPSQQPLRLQGPLDAAWGKARAARRGAGPADAATVAQLHAIGFDTVVACPPVAPAVAGTIVQISTGAMVVDIAGR